MKHLETLEKRQRKSHKKKSSLRAAKVSTTDPEARLMRMADGGFRPGYNAQLVVETKTRLVMAVDVTNQVDQGQMAPMVSQLEKRYGHSPSQHLVDGGFVTMADLRAVSPPHGATTVYAPVPDRGPSTRPLHESHIPPILAWRARRQTPEAQGIYRRRAQRSCLPRGARRVARRRAARQPQSRTPTARCNASSCGLSLTAPMPPIRPEANPFTGSEGGTKGGRERWDSLLPDA